MKIMRLTLLVILLSIAALAGPANPTAQAVGRSELQRALLGTVRVAVKIEGTTQYSTGSGTVVSDKGFIVSNFHVVGDTDTGKFYNADRLAAIAVNPSNLRGLPTWTYMARVVQADARLDISVLQIIGLLDDTNATLPSNLGLTTVPIGDSDNTQIGDEVSVLGFPGLGGDTVTFTQGRISGFLDEDNNQEVEWFKTDAEVNHGNSGGLAIDQQGEMIGIPSAGVSDRQDIGKISLIRPVKLALPLIQAAMSGVGGDTNNGTGGVGGSGPRITGVTYASGVDREGNAINAASSFASGVLNAYAIFDYQDFARGTRIDYTWTLDGKTVANDTINWTTAGDGRDWLSLANDSQPLPDGRYGLEIKVDSVKQHQGGFAIGQTAAPAPPADSARWGPITFAEGVDRNDQPIRPARQFASGLKELYALWDYQGTRDGTAWTRVWYLDGQEVLRNTQNWDQGATGTTWVNINSKSGLPDGSYKLELYLGDKLVQSGTVGIGSGSVLPPVATDDGVQVFGRITDADSGRGVAGALFVVLQPGVTVADWASTFSEQQVYSSGTADSRGDFTLETALARGQAYGMVIVAKGYAPVSEDAVAIAADLESPHELNVTLRKR